MDVVHPLTNETIRLTPERLADWRSELERVHGLDLATMSARSVAMNYSALLKRREEKT